MTTKLQAELTRNFQKMRSADGNSSHKCALEFVGTVDRCAGTSDPTILNFLINTLEDEVESDGTQEAVMAALLQCRATDLATAISTAYESHLIQNPEWLRAIFSDVTQNFPDFAGLPVLSERVRDDLRTWQESNS